MTKLLTDGQTCFLVDGEAWEEIVEVLPQMAERQYIYLLWEADFERDKLVDIYSTREKAETEAEKRKEGTACWDQSGMYIEERVVE